MATKSILKNINIKNRSAARSLILALEKAQVKKSAEVQLRRSCREVKGTDINKFFEENK